MERSDKSFHRDAILVALYCLILFGFAGFSGRPLTMHEARLPETSREMLATKQWLLPTSGGRPWLERPPLPHWLVMSAMRLFGCSDRLWIVRLPSALMGTATVLLTLYIARRWFDPRVGLVAALLLATSYKFYQYACLAEDDIYLAAMVALAAAFFSRAQAPRSSKSPGLSDATSQLSETSSTTLLKNFSLTPGLENASGVQTPVESLIAMFTNRSWSVWGFFAILGLSNLTKGPLLGLIILGAPVGVYLFTRVIMERTTQPLLRYTWVWGWLLLIALTLAWPAWAYHEHPDVIENWRYDYLGRMSGGYAAINEPWWFYAGALPVALLPWAPVCLVGIWILWNHRWEKAFQWVICWAAVPLFVLSIPKGKHDHYLVPFLAPWAMLGAIGLVDIGKRLQLGRRSLISSVICLGLSYSLVEAKLAARTDHTLADTAFLLRCRNEAPQNFPLFINGKSGPPGNLDFFRIQFYSRPGAILLHNLSFLRSTRIANPIVYVIARQSDARLLAQFGKVDQIDQSSSSHERAVPAKSPVGNFVLDRLTFDPGLIRYPQPEKITSLQAMERAPGPWCGPPLE